MNCTRDLTWILTRIPVSLVRTVSFWKQLGEKVRVRPFADSYTPIDNVPVVSAATAWDNPTTGEAIVFVMNQSLDFAERMANRSLLCPNQLRANDVIVNDVPRWSDPQSSHSLYFPEHDLHVPLRVDGVISYLPTRKPTQEELDTCTRIELTGDATWDPYSPDFAAREEELADVPTKTVSAFSTSDEARIDNAQRVLEALSVSPESWDTPDIPERLVSCVNVPSDDFEGDGLSGYGDAKVFPDEYRQAASMASGERGSVLTKEILARRWGIGLETAKKTLQVTTQKGIRRVLHPTERRYRTRQAHMRYPTLNTRFYSDTMFATTKSVRGYKCAQIFTDGKGYDLFYPMITEADAHYQLESPVCEHRDTEGADCRRCDGREQRSVGQGSQGTPYTIEDYRAIQPLAEPSRE